MRYRKKKKSVNSLQIAGIAVFAIAVIFACSWFSYSLSTPADSSAASASSESSLPSAAPDSSAADEKPASAANTKSAAVESGAERSDTSSSVDSAIRSTGGYVPPEEKEALNYDIFDSSFTSLATDQKLAILRDIFPDGKYWTSIGVDISDMTQEEACMIVSDQSCDHNVNGYEYCHEYDGRTMEEYTYGANIQCLGFASMISDVLFGKDADIETFYDYDELSVGDHIRFLSYEHSVIVIEKTDDYVTVVECNRDYEDCMIEWDRTITYDELLYEWADYEFLRRVN